MNARSPYLLSTAAHVMALLTLWILSTLTPHYNFDNVISVEMVMPAPGGAETPADTPVTPSPEPVAESPEQPPAPPPPEEEPEPEPEQRPVAPPEEERKRPQPEDVTDAEATPDGLRKQSQDVAVPSKRGDEQQLPPAPTPKQYSDAPEEAAPETAEFTNGVGAGSVDGNALGDHASWYLARLHGKLSSTWAPPAGGSHVGVQVATVHFVITRDGRIQDLRIVDGNANTRFRRSVQRCVLNASPLPPLPEDLAASSIGVTVPFRKQY